MCGIICMFSKCNENVDLEKEFFHFKENIVNRGPDSLKLKKFSSESKYDFLFATSVLWLQGKFITEQPLDNNLSIFVYNGDVFGGLSDDERLERGDTMLLFNSLENTKSISLSMSKVQGPNSFIFYDKTKEILYFGRDLFGRRSLLIGKHKEHFTLRILTSVARRTQKYDFIELPSIGTFSWNLRTDELTIMPFQFRNQNFNIKLTELEEFLKMKIVIKQEVNMKESKIFLEPTVAQLDILKNIHSIETEQAFQILFKNLDWLNNICKLKELLKEAMKKRISTQPKYCKSCIRQKLNCGHSTTGILFSGGVDCSVLALLAHEFVDKNRPIDLMNVAFNETTNFKSPDRLTGLETLTELKILCPDRNWRFIEIDVTQLELEEERKRRIADLIFPLQSILDDSLGCALWFASRGKGSTMSSPCRVLLVGMGADELFGGYTRHRACFKKMSWLGLHNSLNEDWQNLSHRNLARDDRVVSDHGRQLRTPYLDENVVEFVRNLHCWQKSYPSDNVPKGLGDKILLRSLAYYMGLKNAAKFQKRALQFGSRIANKNENAHEISKRLLF